MPASLQQLSTADAIRLDQGGELWTLYRQAVSDSLYFAVKSVFSQRPAARNQITTYTHLPLALTLQAVNEGQIRRLLIEYPRGFLKSTFATEGRPPHKLCQMVVAGLDPSIRFMLRSSSTANSQRFWWSIKRLFETNELFQFLFPELIPDFRTAEKWNESIGIVPRLYNPKEPTFDTLGGGSATTRHYDDGTEEDLVNEENWDSPSAIRKAIEIHKQSEHLMEDLAISPLVTVGNRWDFRDVNHTIHTEEPDTVILSAGASHGPKLTGKYKCRGLPETVTEILTRMQGEILWPERFSREVLGQLLLKNKPRVFMAQMENEPADPDATDFRLEWLKSCKLEYADGQPVLIYEDDPTPVLLRDTNVYMTWDPAADGPQAESRNAIIVSSIDYRGRIAIIREYAKKEDPRKSIDAFFALAKLFRPYLKACGIEEVIFAKVLGDIVRDRAKAESIWLGMRKLKVPHGLVKDQRIRTWVGTYFENGLVYLREGLIEFPQEYAHFGIPGSPRDLMDALAHATRLYRKPAAPSEAKRQAARADFIQHNRGVTGYGSALAI